MWWARLLNSIIPILDAGAGAAAANSYESIATLTATGGGLSYAEFTSIPSTYKHLQIRLLTKTGATGGPYNVQMRLNSDTAANYVTHRLFGNGSAVTANATTGATQMAIYYEPDSTQTNMFGVGVVDILDYADTNKNTTVRSLGGYDANGSGYSMFFSNLWLNPAAVNTIRIFTESSQNLAQYSQIALYGVK